MKQCRLWIFFVFLFISGCVKQPLDLSLQASSRINLSASGRPLPVRLRFFQLISSTKFQQANFNSLWKAPGISLGDELVSSQSITVLPTEHQKIHFHRQAKTRYFGVIGIFRQPIYSHWKSVCKLNSPIPYIPSHIYISVQNNTIRMHCS